MNKRYFCTLFTSFLSLSVFGTILMANNNNYKEVDAVDTTALSTDFAKWWNDSTAVADSSGYKYLAADTDYQLGDGTKINMQVEQNAANELPKIRNYNNKNTNYYMYLKYNNSHTENKIGNGIIFNATQGSKILSFEISSVRDANNPIQIQTYNTSTGVYDVETQSATLTASQKFSHEFTSGVSSFKIYHLCGATKGYDSFKDITINYYDVTCYYLTFDSQGGTDVLQQEFIEGESTVSVEPTDPTRANEGSTKYTFAGWYTDPECTDGNEFVFGTTITENTTVYAKWTEETISGYTCTFMNEGVTYTTQVAEVGNCFVAPANPTKSSDAKYNYTFDAWYTDEDLTTAYDFSTVATSDLTLYAGFEYSQTSIDGATQVSMKTNIKTFAASWSTSSYEEHTLDSSEVSDSMVDSTFEFAANESNGGIRYSGNWDVRIYKALVTWQLNDYSKYIQTVRWDIKNTQYAYSTSSTVALYASRDGSGSVIDSDYMAIKSGAADRCVQMLNNADETINAVSFVNNNSGHYYYGFEKLNYILGTASDAQQAIFFSEAFVREFTCDGSGSITNDVWTTFANRIATMSDTSLNALKTANWKTDALDSNVAAALERYDYIIGKYGTDQYADFLNRTADGGGYVAPANAFIGVFTNSSTSYTFAIVLFVALTSTICVALYLVRRRKNYDK